MSDSGVVSVWRAGATRWVLLAVAVASSVGWWSGWYPRSIRWGDVASWVAALATVGAVAIALWAGLSARKAGEAARETATTSLNLLQVERQRDIDREAEIERNHQAALVAAWHPPGHAHGYLANYSPLPIRTLRIAFVYRFSNERWTYTGESVDKVPNRGLFETGKHELRWPAEGPPSSIFDGMSPHDDYSDYLAVEVTFRDTRGVVWFLDGAGSLSKRMTDHEKLERWWSSLTDAQHTYMRELEWTDPLPEQFLDTLGQALGIGPAAYWESGLDHAFYIRSRLGYYLDRKRWEHPG